MPESMTTLRIYETKPITLITPLYIPTELTQKAPNKGKISKELTVEALAPRPALKAPSPPPPCEADTAVRSFAAATGRQSRAEADRRRTAKDSDRTAQRAANGADRTVDSAPTAAAHSATEAGSGKRRAGHDRAGAGQPGGRSAGENRAAQHLDRGGSCGT